MNYKKKKKLLKLESLRIAESIYAFLIFRHTNIQNLTKTKKGEKYKKVNQSIN